MPGHDIIVIGASAGGVEALTRLVKALPTDLPAAIFVVLHVPAHGTSLMPNILNRCGTLRAWHPEDGAPIQHGQIYVAPPNYHLLVKQGYVHLARGPRENGHRPAVDPLFRTAAQHYGRRVIGVVLSGNLDDGTAGLAAVKSRGGIAIVQDPDDALFNEMPRSAVENVDVDYILPLSAIAPTLVRLVQEPVPEEETEMVTGDLEIESDLVELDMAAHTKYDRPGTPSGFACPECGGALWELGDGKLIRFRCRTGHTFSGESLLAEQSEALETALWSGLRALEERAALAHRMFQGARDRNQTRSAARFAEQEQEAQQNAAIIREVLLKDLKDGDGERVGNGQNGKGADKGNGGDEESGGVEEWGRVRIPQSPFPNPQ